MFVNLSHLLFKLFIADLIFAFTAKCSTPNLHDLAVSSIQFADGICYFFTTEVGIGQSIECALEYCEASHRKINITKQCYTVYNGSEEINRGVIIINRQALKFDPQPCYLGVCLPRGMSIQCKTGS